MFNDEYLKLVFEREICEFSLELNWQMEGETENSVENYYAT